MNLKQSLAQFYLLIPYIFGWVTGAISAVVFLTAQAFKLGYEKSWTTINGQDNDDITTD
jgi:hypothetical protein